MAGKTRPYDYAKGSLANVHDPEVKRRIRRGRRIADADLASVNAWAAGGCTALISLDVRHATPFVLLDDEV